MIARIWHGWTKPADAKAYEKLLRDEIFPSIAARKIEGYRGAELFIREDGNEVEFVTLLRFDSMDAVTEFAGPETSKPVIFPKAEALITRMEQARHYRVAIRWKRCPNALAGTAARRLFASPHCHRLQEKPIHLASEALALQLTCATFLVMELASKLREILDDEIVADDPETLAAHSGDKWFATHPPEVVVFARSTADVSKLLQFASREKVPVTARGGGFGYVGGCVPARGGIVLSLMRMNRIKEINFTDAVAIVEPGVFTGELKAAVRAQKLFYPPDPASMKDCTIGGNVATNAGGPRCLKYGVTRNYVIGLEVVLANGEVLRTGGRVHKNKTGFDLIGLFVGSEGMLGVVTEITLRLLPLPPARATLSAAFATAPQAAEAVQAIFAAGFLPSAARNCRSFHARGGAARFGREDRAQRETRICSSIWMGNKRASAARPRPFAN